VTNDDTDRPVRSGSRCTAGFLARIASAKGGPLSIAALTSVPTSRAEVAVQHALLCARVAQDNKARNIVLLDMRGITPLYDFFILATGASRRQIHTITEEIDDAMHERGDRRLSVEGYQSSKWVVQDYGDVVVHVFDEPTRQYYAIEELWADAPRVDWQRHY
jgi:ribosome-associated protein